MAKGTSESLLKPMSIEAFSKFLDANPDVAKKVAACQNYNEVAEIAKANGINVTGAELTKHVAQQTSELSDEALEAVAGGTWSHPGGGGNKPLTSVNPNPGPFNPYPGGGGGGYTSIFVK